jgi:hypothetical protein
MTEPRSSAPDAAQRCPAHAASPSGSHRATRPPVAPSRADPGRMSADERLREVISLLAAGFLRSRAVDAGEKDLDVLRTPSDVCPEPRSEGESL